MDHGAHCARGFFPQPLERAGRRLADLSNVYFDSAAVCEYASYDYLLEHVGPGRLLYGSDDLPACVDRGKYLTWGEAWGHVNQQILDQVATTVLDATPTFIRYEVLRALCRAIRRHRLAESDVDRIFRATATDLIADAQAAVG